MLSGLRNWLTDYSPVICLALGASLLAVGTASAQESMRSANDTTRGYTWGNGGIGAGKTGLGLSVVGGVPVGSHLFAGGRYVRTEEFNISLGPTTPPSAEIWEAGPLVGFVAQGRYSHVSVGSGIALVGGRRPDERESNPSTVGLPLDVQAFFTPTRYLGIGLHGYATVSPEENLLGVSLQLQIRISQ